MKLDAPDHPKTQELRSLLGCSKAAAVGHLELLWHCASVRTPRGDIGKLKDAYIAEQCAWEGDPAKFVKALVDAGWLAEMPEHRLVVHDWRHHAPAWVVAKLKRDSASFIDDTKGALNPELDLGGEGSKGPLLSSPLQAMPSHTQEGKGSRCFVHFPVSSGRQGSAGTVEILHFQVEAWKRDFPNVNVEQQLRKMRAWLEANPRKRKTARGVKAFVVNWLSKEQDRGGTPDERAHSTGAHRQSARDRVGQRTRERS